MDSIISKAGVVGVIAACVLSVGSALARESNGDATATCTSLATSAYASAVASCETAFRMSDPRFGLAAYQLCLSTAYSDYTSALGACQGSARTPLKGGVFARPTGVGRHY